jgi:acyl-coenzyme A synthetase/AMP-(fatty) acid ligase
LGISNAKLQESLSHNAGGATEADRFLLLAPVGFMASIPPLLCALLTGASLHPFNVGAEGVDALVRFIGAERITVYHSVPTLLRRLASVEDARESLKSVRLVRLAGEIVRPTDVRLVRELFPAGAPVQILMGAAETSLIAHHTMSFSEPMPEGVVPIGRAAPGVEVMILDERGNAVRTGEPGRLVVRGRTISPGYWNRLSERGPFVADADDPTLVMYQTSDTCRVREDGLLELLGRSEEFIKVRGVRVSPAAIEAALVELPDVRDAAVVGLTRDGEERAVAYVVARVGRRPRGGELRRALAAMLPEAMVPAEVMILPSLPLTASGKVDRHALPEPRPLVRPRWRRPRDDVEGQVAAAWSMCWMLSAWGWMIGLMRWAGRRSRRCGCCCIWSG